MGVFKNTLWMGHIITDLDRIIQLLAKQPFNGSGQLMSKREHIKHAEVSELSNLLFSYSPIGDVTASYFACNNPGTTVDPQLTATVTAGSNVTAFWESWPHNIGPIMVYMAVSI